MFKRLRKRFALSFSLASFLILSVIFGFLALGSYISTETSIKESLEEAVLRYDMATIPTSQESSQGETAQEAVQDPGAGKMLPRVFYASYTEEGEVTLFGEAIFPMDKEAIVSECQAIISSDTEFGTYQRTHYLHKTDMRLICFMDTESEMSSYSRTLLTSGIVCGSAFLAMVIASIFLARFAVRPYESLYRKERAFLTDASHELKTPLAIIRANAEAGLLEDKGNAYLLNVKKQEGRLSSLVEELIILNRLGEAGVREAPSDLSLSELVLDAVECYAPLFEKRNVQIEDDIEEGITIKRDERMLSRLVGIFFDNAAKYALPDGPVCISLKRGRKGPVLSIENSCEPLTQIEADSLFDRFHTRDESRARDKSGFGIGLSLAKEISSRSGDEATVRMVSPSRIRFEVRFHY